MRWFLFFLSLIANLNGEKNSQEIIYFQPNTTQIFTELYQAHGLLNPPARTFFEEALYLDQSIPPTLIPLQPADQAVFDYTSDALSNFHRKMKDLELYIEPLKPKPFFYTAVGSKHLIVALCYAIALTEPNKKFLFVEQAPFYSGHPNAVSGLFTYPNARFQAFHEVSEVKLEPGEILVEFVTSPNNPDGKFRQPLTDAEIIIADFVFASAAFGDDGSGYLDKNIEWIRKARASGKHVFSFNSASKQFGKTGARVGYIWYPLYDPYAASIFNKFFGFISSSTVACGTTGLEEFLNLTKALLDLPDLGKELRNQANKSLIKRHRLIEKELLNRYPDSKVISVPGSPTFFAKIADHRIPATPAWKVIQADFGAVVNSGSTMGETDEFIRLNLSGYSQILAEFLNRLAGEKKYSVQDVLIADKPICSQVKVSSKIYFATPGDCQIDVDASKWPVEIILSPFTGYLESNKITIKKIDTSENAVTIKSENFNKSLKASNESLHVQWAQNLYLNGRWDIKVDP